MKLWHIGLWALCTLSSGLAAQETQDATPEIEPADMHPGINPWGGAIEFPAGDEDVNVFVQCRGRITDAGQVKIVSCNVFERCWGFFTQSKHWEDSYCPATKIPAESPYFAYGTTERRFLNAIYRAAGPVRVTPATIDGQRREVMTVFSFLFLRDEGEESIVLFQSHLPRRDKAGLTYVAPQIYERERPMSRFCIMPNHVALRYTVRIDGTADVAVVPHSDRRRDCVDRSVAHLGFIPGQRDGKPIETVIEIERGPSRNFYPYQ